MLFFIKLNVFQVAVAIPANNEEARLESALSSVNNAIQFYESPITKIVVNSASTDRTPDIARDLGFHVIPSELGIANARNAALDYAVGQGCKYLLTTDADCIIPQGWVKTHVQRLNQIDNPAMTIGRVKFHYEKDMNPLTVGQLRAYDAVKALMIFLRKKRGIYHATSANMGLNVQDVVDVGGYPKVTGCNEDLDLMNLLISKDKLISTVDTTLTTSSRRILGEGLMRIGLARFLKIFGIINKAQRDLEKDYRIIR